MSFTCDIRGLPRPQGSMALFRAKNGHEVAKYPQPVIQWRQTVQQAVLMAMNGLEAFLGPVELRLGFDLPRPAAHFLPVNGRRAVPELRTSAPLHVTVMPDLDKLIRAVADACTDAGLWKDDAQVARIIAAKRYAETPPGVHITVVELP